MISIIYFLLLLTHVSICSFFSFTETTHHNFLLLREFLHGLLVLLLAAVKVIRILIVFLHFLPVIERSFSFLDGVTQVFHGIAHHLLGECTCLEEFLKVIFVVITLLGAVCLLNVWNQEIFCVLVLVFSCRLDSWNALVVFISLFATSSRDLRFRCHLNRFVLFLERCFLNLLLDFRYSVALVVILHWRVFLVCGVLNESVEETLHLVLWDYLGIQVQFVLLE